MINPVELISRSRTRLARLAAARAVITGLPLVAVTLGLGASVNLAAASVCLNWGYRIAPEHAALLRAAAFGAAGVAAIATAGVAWRGWRRDNDFAQAAQRIDALIGAHQELLTLATLADPAHPAARDQRSPLFAVLWGRAITYLERFEPNRAFALAPGAPLRRSALLAGAAIVTLGLAMFALMRLPSPVQAAADRLRDLAGNTPATTTPAAEALAAAARDVANDLDNPRLPPQQKLAELEAIKREIEQVQQPPPNAQSGSSGNSQGQGKGNGNGAGDGSGGTGEGTGGGANDKGAGAGTGGAGQGNKSDQQHSSLKNDLAKAQAKLEADANSGKTETAEKQDQQGSGSVPQAGENPHQAGPGARPNGVDNVQLPESGRTGISTGAPASSNTTAHKDDTGTQGDTHLGDFPKAVAYERFYKLGDKGPPLDLKNARYVTFRLPPAVVAGNGEGRTVHDAGAPAAITPYTNAPLKEEPLTASSDEEQLLPPRYRDLIR